ncbi:RlpA-like double-psi beta-barrel domain-containing protein [Plastoroseomonas arctica]|uniref:Endolytic peptidoglycan transglycosylase RlpA n=1 Tax=Plastoroseomonas arctica TaxID=1509237 RepID=A0AAF1KHS4_9PROT|nr:RlpA-like double-psi beta-barrel domain-containing protein [Plastoroseomonas arctica]MBR0653760.1 sporulation and cell division repeat protein [Plastoroseomonas arctica]
MRHFAWLFLLVLTGCFGPTPQPRYLVGEPYRLGGVWSYPRESFALSETGIGQALADRTARLTANGERWDARLPMAAHRTLQLPAVLRVQNLENGRAMLVRVNDRGPERAGRILGLSAQSAALLGIAEGGTAQLRITVEAEMSRALANRTAGRQVEALPVEAAPRASVSSESLAPPPGARDAGGSAIRPVAALASEAVSGFAEVTIPSAVTQGSPQPGVLVIEAGTFSRADAANLQLARLRPLGASIEQRGRGTSATYRVRIGPVAALAEADRVLERVLSSGVSEAAIRVE